MNTEEPTTSSTKVPPPDVPRATSRHLKATSTTPTPNIVIASDDHPTTYSNTSGSDLSVDTTIDGVSTHTVIKAGAVASVGQCPPAAQTCTVRVYLPGDNGTATDYFVKSYARPASAPTGTPSSVDVFAGGAGYGPGFTAFDDHLVYANTRSEAVTIVYHDGTSEDRTFTVKPGANITLPKCDSTARCDYAVGTGTYDPGSPETFILRRGVSVGNGSAMYGGTGYDDTDFHRAGGQLVYTNTQPTVVSVYYQDQYGQQTLVTIAAGQTIALPECAGADNVCNYSVQGPNFQDVADLTVSNGSAGPGGPTPPPSGSGTSPAPGGNVTPPQTGGGGSHPANAPGNNGWYVPPSQLDLCAQIAGGAKAASSPQLSNVALACTGATLGMAAGSGNWKSFTATAIGLGAGFVADRLAYWPSVAVNVWSYTAGQAVQADWSAFGSTTSYAWHNPGVVVQETVKATGVVLSNIWPAFIPKW